MQDGKTAVHEASGIENRLALDGGTPVRTEPLPLEFPGVHHMDEEEVTAVGRVVKSRSLFRYYGLDLQKEVENFESEFASFLGVSHVLAVSSGTGALQVALSALGVGPGQFRYWRTLTIPSASTPQRWNRRSPAGRLASSSYT